MHEALASCIREASLGTQDRLLPSAAPKRTAHTSAGHLSHQSQCRFACFSHWPRAPKDGDGPAHHPPLASM